MVEHGCLADMSSNCVQLGFLNLNLGGREGLALLYSGSCNLELVIAVLTLAFCLGYELMTILMTGVFTSFRRTVFLK